MDHLSSLANDVWRSLQAESQSFVRASDPVALYVSRLTEGATNLGAFLSALLAHQLASPLVDGFALRDLFASAHVRHPALAAQAAQDILAVKLRDPAAEGLLRPLLFFKGIHALQTHRLAHALWSEGQRDTALFLQNRSSVVFGVDIHPAARLGAGLMMDHATGIVIGETAVVEDDVSILHGVTLGGTGNEQGDRHPKVRRGVMIGAGAKVLGNIEIGEGACIASGSVVLKPVPPHVTVAGVPAQIVGTPRSNAPALAMDQTLPEEA